MKGFSGDPSDLRIPSEKNGRLGMGRQQGPAGTSVRSTEYRRLSSMLLFVNATDKLMLSSADRLFFGSSSVQSKTADKMEAASLVQDVMLDDGRVLKNSGWRLTSPTAHNENV